MADPFGIRNLRGGRIPFRGNQSTKSIPVANLPENLSYETGKVSLIADFAKSDQNRVPVYLINSAGSTFRMETIALEIPIVLEAYLGNGHWERAESHNAYGFLSTRKEENISTSHFRVKKARYWGQGEKATLRYALYQDGRPEVVSESFEGRLPVGEIDKARHDLMTASIVPLPLRIRYFPEQTTTTEVARDWYNKLILLRSFGPCYVDLSEAQKWVAFVHESPVSTREDRDLAVKLQLEMLKTWPGEYDLSRLHERCQSILKTKADHTEKLRPLCWKILKEDSEENSELRDPELAQVAWKTIQSGTVLSELEAATDFLCVNHIAKNHSPILEYENHLELLEHKNPYVRITAANFMMSKKVQHDAVINHYKENQSSIGAYELVRILHFDRLYKAYDPPHWDLWGNALDKDIEYSIFQLSMMFESDNTPTKLRKFPQSSILPPEIKKRIVKYYEQAPNGPKKQSIKRLLDDVNTRKSRFLQRTFL